MTIQICMSKRGGAELLQLLCFLEYCGVLKVLCVYMTSCKSGLALHRRLKPSACIVITISHSYFTTFHHNFQL